MASLKSFILHALIPTVVLMFCLQALSMRPAYAFALAFALMIVLVWHYRDLLWSFAISISATLIMIEIMLRLVGGASIYYRPHEKLLDGAARYKAAQKLEKFAMAHGDLIALNGGALPEITEPRKLRFITDYLGFRNEGIKAKADVAAADYILLGDSFVVGNGTDQNDILSVRLGSPKRFYNAGFPGEIKDYLNRYEQHLASIFSAPDKGRIMLFLFEGNDFHCAAPHAANSFKERIRANPLFRLKKRVDGAIHTLKVYRLTYGLTQRAWLNINKMLGRQESAVAVYKIGAQKLGFYKFYISESQNKRFCISPQVLAKIKQHKDKIALISFIPTKYRTYYPLLSEKDRAKSGAPSEAVPQGAAQLAQSHNIPFLDLTPVLRDASSRLLSENKYSFWRDDTHWNKHGIEAAKVAIEQKLQ